MAIRRHLAYLRYVLRHKWYVLRGCRMVGAPLWVGMIHDLSKFSWAEWCPYARTFYDQNGQKRFQKDPGFDKAWKHHQEHNAHHWQWWITPNGIPLQMPEATAREMVADWIGAGLAINGRIEVLDWYAKERDKMALHPMTRALVETVLQGLR